MIYSHSSVIKYDYYSTLNLALFNQIYYNCYFKVLLWRGKKRKNLKNLKNDQMADDR